MNWIYERPIKTSLSEENLSVLSIAMKLIFLILLSIEVLLIVGCRNENKINEKVQSRRKENMYDSINIAILPYDPSTSFPFEKGIATELIAGDHQKIDKILGKCIQEYNSKQNGRNHQTISRKPYELPNSVNQLMPLNSYKRQYIAVLNQEGEKLVWVNCFCISYDNQWRYAPVMVKDGGSCYFNVTINLTQNKYYEFSVNGEG